MRPGRRAAGRPAGRARFRLLFLRHRGLFLNFSFFRVFGKTLIPKGAYRPWDHFRFLVKNDFGDKLPVKSCLFFL